jgi:hypothetical protein
VCAVLEESGHAVLALQDTGAAGVDYLVSDEIDLNAETVHWMSVTAAKVHHVPRLAQVFARAHDPPGHRCRTGSGRDRA